MPSKKKATSKNTLAPEGSVHEAPPVETAVPEATARPDTVSGFVWPVTESLETVQVPLDLETKAAMAEQFTSLENQRQSVTIAKKAAAEGYAGQLSDIAAGIDRICTSMDSGMMERRILCRWVFETKERTPDGEGWLFDPHHKALVRSDTGAIVRVTLITEQERQGTLNFVQTEEEMEAELLALGWLFTADDAPPEGRPPFYIEPEVSTGDNPEFHDIEGVDNRKDALAGALRWVKSREVSAPSESAAPTNEGMEAYLRDVAYELSEVGPGHLWLIRGRKGIKNITAGTREEALPEAYAFVKELETPEPEEVAAA